MDPRGHDGRGTVRGATPADAGALARLCRCIGSDALVLGDPDIRRCLARGHLLVLDLGNDTVGAAAHVALYDIRGALHGRIEFFAIDPALTGTGAEDRLAEALLVLCETSGCVDVDVPGPPEPIRVRG